ncbi:hypothetical protein JB92DRAFT_3006883 [Gautieria morchelliformis]|nr:hypothetical protein JB92DRAFT_3006883 [Gautieria morchelliformis]
MPALAFTIRDHLAGQLSRTEHDPLRNSHHIPTFESDAPRPILYLPPLLSLLPTSHHAPQKLPSHPSSISETRLPDIDPASLSLHRALHHFKPSDDQYATRPYSEAFNWDLLQLPEEDEREWYCVAFRSLRKAGSDGDSLYQADKEAHEEAVRNGGLIMYWYGVPSPETGHNLATCIWQSRQHAILANSRPKHIRAAKLAKAAYETYELERWVVQKVKGETGIHIGAYKEGPVGW